RFWSKCLKPIRARIRRASPCLRGEEVRPTWRGRRSPLLRRQSGLLDHAPGGDAILDEEAGKFLRRVQDRLQRAIDELFLAEGELAADADHVFPDLVDDRLGRARWREQAEIDAGGIAAI